jgi:pyruvate/2-oxoglutarate dehydrogenase complex dihydrolipoamide dehydrogenase (E3) component
MRKLWRIPSKTLIHAHCFREARLGAQVGLVWRKRNDFSRLMAHKDEVKICAPANTSMFQAVPGLKVVKGAGWPSLPAPLKW